VRIAFRRRSMRLGIFGLLLVSAFAFARADVPTSGAHAPALTYTQLLQAPAGAKVDWRSLRGKVVVLEFWATWCGPCIEEIPTLNQLANSLDPAKVQFISVDDEDPKIVEPFLKKHPISGWVLLDTSGALNKRYGIQTRPTTIVIDTKGNVVTALATPETLKRDKLLLLAQGKPTEVISKADAAAEIDMEAAMAKMLQDSDRANPQMSNALFELSITPGDSSQKATMMSHGVGIADIANAPVEFLVQFGMDTPESRIEIKGVLPKMAYNLHLHAPGMDKARLKPAVELAIEAATGARIEHVSTVEDVYLIEPLDKAKGVLQVSPETSSFGMAFYSTNQQSMQLINASMDQMAVALESALGSPVVNETGIQNKVLANFKMTSKDVAAAKAALETNLGLTLVPAKRPVERLIVSADDSKDAVPVTTAAK
jgi:thiol-disulfide isomerase/thioredoxin